MKQVMKPRSYRLENTSLIAAVFALAAWLGAGCADTPYVGTWHQCHGQLVCDGIKYGITGKTCSDTENVVEDYKTFSVAWVEHQGAMCDEMYVDDVECVDTTELCSY